MKRSVGIIVPSANVVVERTAIAYAAARPGLEIHFARVPVRGDQANLSLGYDVDAFYTAADLLADAQPNVLLWAGSMGILIGIEHDKQLRIEIERRTGITFTTPSLALAEIVKRDRISRIGLVSPYTFEYQRRLVDGFSRIGLDCIAEAHAGISDNLSYADVDTTTILSMAVEVAEARPEVIVTWCTNFSSIDCGEQIKAITGLRLHDATMIGLDHAVAKIDQYVVDDLPLVEPVLNR